MSPRSSSNSLSNHTTDTQAIDEDEQIQRDYADRLRAALSDVTMEKDPRNKHNPYGRNRFAVKKRKPRKYLRKDQKLINVNDWL